MVKVKLTENIRNGKIFRHAFWTYYPIYTIIHMPSQDFAKYIHKNMLQFVFTDIISYFLFLLSKSACTTLFTVFRFLLMTFCFLYNPDILGRYMGQIIFEERKTGLEIKGKYTLFYKHQNFFLLLFSKFEAQVVLCRCSFEAYSEFPKINCLFNSFRQLLYGSSLNTKTDK